MLDSNGGAGRLRIPNIFVDYLNCCEANVGAGHTGLLEALCSAYLVGRSGTASIAWVHNHSRNNQLALLHGHVDIALTYERDQERLAQAEGWLV